MKVLLINAPRISPVWCGVPDIFNGKDQHLFPPLGIMYLSAWLKERTDHEVTIVDPNAEELDYPAIEGRIRSFGPDVVGITALTHNLVDVHRCAQAAKRVSRDIHVTLGGPHAIAFPEQSLQLPHVDSVVIDRDAEETFGDWVEALASRRKREEVAGVWFQDRDGTVHRSPARPIKSDLSHLPFPDRSSINLRDYYTPGMKGFTATTMATTRGCPQGCHFCLSSSTFTARTPENVVDEMEHCRSMGIQEVQFVDDIFNSPSTRVLDLSEEILRRKVDMAWGFKAVVNAAPPEVLEKAAQAGCNRAHFGVETGTEAGLRSLGKNFATLDDSRNVFRWCRELGICSIAYIMIGIPEEKCRADVMKTVDFVRELDPDFVVYAIMSPYPHTPLWQKGARLGLWDPDVWARFMANPTEELAAEIPTVWTQHMDKEELVQIFKDVNRQFYFNPRTVFRTLSQISTFEELKRVYHGGLAIARLQLLRASGRRI